MLTGRDVSTFSKTESLPFSESLGDRSIVPLAVVMKYDG